MSDPIRAALEAACATDGFWMDGDSPARGDILRDRAAAIAAFLRAAPDVIPLGKDMQVSLCRTTRVLLAQEVERAARTEGGRDA